MRVQSSLEKRKLSKRNMAALLAIFVGGTGAHLFYVGKWKRGIFILIFFITSLLTTPIGIGAIFAVALPILMAVEGITWLFYSKEKFYDEIQIKNEYFK